MLVNGVLYMFTGRSPVIWAIFMGIAMYILLYSISRLVISDKLLNSHNVATNNEGLQQETDCCISGNSNYRRMCNFFIAALVVLYPFSDLNDTGWISVTTTYFFPLALGMFSLIPIKMILNKEKFIWWQYIVFSLTLVYSANQEQMMVVLLGCYLVMLVYLIIKKEVNPYIIIQLILLIISMCVVVLSPGNAARKEAEISSHFPTFEMLNVIDKFDIGYSTAMKWLFFGSNAFMIACTAILAWAMWKKYSQYYIRAVALIPFALITMLGPLKSITTTMFPWLVDLTTEIDIYGLVTPGNRGSFEFLTKYMVYATLLIILILIVIVTQKNLKGLIASVTVLATGLASRVALGYSPSIYASGVRTCEILAFCVILVTCLIYCQNVENRSISSSECKKVTSIMIIPFTIGIINIMLMC